MMFHFQTFLLCELDNFIFQNLCLLNFFCFLCPDYFVLIIDDSHSLLLSASYKGGNLTVILLRNSVLNTEQIAACPGQNKSPAEYFCKIFYIFIYAFVNSHGKPIMTTNSYSRIIEYVTAFLKQSFCTFSGTEDASTASERTGIDLGCLYIHTT